MSTTVGTTTFYVAPSKEHHPLVSELLLMEYERGYEKKKERVVRVSRDEGFLTGTFGTIDADVRDDAFMKLYEKLGNLGYISEDHRHCWDEPYSLEGCYWSNWYDQVGNKAYVIGTNEVVVFNNCNLNPFLDEAPYAEDVSRANRKERARKFWEGFPNLMHLLKYGQPAQGPHH